MGLLGELFSDWVGWLSFLVIAFIGVMAVFFIVWFRRNMENDEKRQQLAARRNG